jgi:hypothetical protein
MTGAITRVVTIALVLAVGTISSATLAVAEPARHLRRWLFLVHGVGIR